MAVDKAGDVSARRQWEEVTVTSQTEENLPVKNHRCRSGSPKRLVPPGTKAGEKASRGKILTAPRSEVLR